MWQLNQIGYEDDHDNNEEEDTQDGDGYGYWSRDLVFRNWILGHMVWIPNKIMICDWNCWGQLGIGFEDRGLWSWGIGRFEFRNMDSRLVTEKDNLISQVKKTIQFTPSQEV